MTINSSGQTRLYLSAGIFQGNRDDLLRALESRAREKFAILGEIGFGEGAIYYLARRLEDALLVALKLSRQEGAGSFNLDVLETLNASVPTHESECPECGAELGHLTNFCPMCRADLRGDTDASREQLLGELRRVAQGRFEILGGMPFGSGSVFFGRERGTGRLVSFRLVRSGNDGSGGARYDLAKVSTLRLPGALDKRDPHRVQEPRRVRPVAVEPIERGDQDAAPPVDGSRREDHPPPPPRPPRRPSGADEPAETLGGRSRRERVAQKAPGTLGARSGRRGARPSVPVWRRPALQIVVLLGALGGIAVAVFAFIL